MEITAIRSRGSYFSPTAIVSRLGTLKRAYNNSAEINVELLRYAPIATVSMLEAFVRYTISELCNRGEPFIGNALKNPELKDRKFDLKLLSTLHTTNITVGDLIAHAVPVKRLDSVLSIIGSISGYDFKVALKNVHNRWDTEVRGLPAIPIIDNIDLTLGYLSSAFEYRHIYAHELADKHQITPDEVTNIIASLELFINASTAVLSNILHPNSPLTQKDMTEKACEMCKMARDSLNRGIEEIKASLSENQRLCFEKVVNMWRIFANEWGKFEGLKADGSSMQTMLGCMGLRDATVTFEKMLKDTYLSLADEQRD